MNIKILSIDEIGLSNRSVNALHRVEIYTVGEMIELNEEFLHKIRNIGEKSIEEICKKIQEYKILETNSNIEVPEDFDEWIMDESNQQFIITWLRDNKIKIDELELLSVRAYNLLIFSGYEYLYQVAFLTEKDLMQIARMDDSSASEIVRYVSRYIAEHQEQITALIVQMQSAATSLNQVSIFDILYKNEYHDVILDFVKLHDILLDGMNISNRAKNSLSIRGYYYLSDIVFMTYTQLKNIPSMGAGTAKEVIDKINEYLSKYEARILAFVSGDVSGLWDDTEIQQRIWREFRDIGFQGLSLNEIVERMKLPEQVTIERIKKNIGQLIVDKKLEYVDYRCYRVYARFADYLEQCDVIDERSKNILRKRLQSMTLEEIGQEEGITRERVRQILKKGIVQIKKIYKSREGTNLFDEDYYRYLYENYDFDKKDGTEWLGIPVYVWKYLELNDVKQGKKELQSALEDQQGLDLGMRLKIKNYLNRNKLFVDGRWIEKERAELEKVVIRKFCQEDVSFGKFCQIYNQFLTQEEIPYDEDIYYTETVYRTRKNRIRDLRYLLWKQHEQIRYYDIDGRDYDELLDTLNLDAYENIELSTEKFMRDYPEIMKKYDIRDKYELHNLLRKIISEESYHEFFCERTPNIRFGHFDRDAAVFDILIDNAPIGQDALANLISEEYGYDADVVIANYLKSVSEYYHQGIYSIDQKLMSEENRKLLQEALTDDFYFMDEIRQIYDRLIPGADREEINPYNLKVMGFHVYSRYAIQNHPFVDAYFDDLLTREDIIDITAYKKRYAYVQMFSQKLMELKRDLTVIEFEKNQIINFRKLEQSGVTKNMIQQFCDNVYSFVTDGTYFSIQSLIQDGFQSDLYELGFSDWFYANLLISDERFSSAMMFGNLIFYKGKASITIKMFEKDIICKYQSMDTYDLVDELTDRYGCKVPDKYDVIYKVQDTEVYYDKILDRLYANMNVYDEECERGGF